MPKTLRETHIPNIHNILRILVKFVRFWLDRSIDFLQNILVISFLLYNIPINTNIKSNISHSIFKRYKNKSNKIENVEYHNYVFNFYSFWLYILYSPDKKIGHRQKTLPLQSNIPICIPTENFKKLLYYRRIILPSWQEHSQEY